MIRKDGYKSDEERAYRPYERSRRFKRSLEKLCDIAKGHGIPRHVIADALMSVALNYYPE